MTFQHIRSEHFYSVQGIIVKYIDSSILKIIMLARHLARGLFGIQNYTNKHLRKLDSDVHEIFGSQQKLRREIREKQQNNLPADINLRAFYDSIVNINLYMRQDCWKSQYIYLMLNYHKLGFRRISDLVFLDRASYFLDLRKMRDQERWPSIKVTIALEPKIILTGIQPINEFFEQNAYYTEQMSADKSEQASVKEFIEQNIVPYLESLFWHPLLTHQYTFHSNQSSYQDITKDTYIFGILGRNGLVIGQRIARNIVNIFKENERYRNSKQKLREGLTEIVKACLQRQQFIGGKKPGHLDFYLMALLRAKSGSYLFMRYLENEVGGDFWSWYMRMSSMCQYSPDRVTTL